MSLYTIVIIYICYTMLRVIDRHGCDRSRIDNHIWYILVWRMKELTPASSLLPGHGTFTYSLSFHLLFIFYVYHDRHRLVSGRAISASSAA